MKMYEKLIISFILISFIPISILGTVTVIHFRDFALESSAREVYNNLTYIKLRITEMTNEAVNIANKLMIDQRLKELLLYKYKSPMETYLKYTQYKEIENYKTLFARAISQIRIYSENPTILENGIFYKVNDNTKNKPWYKLALRLNGFIRWEIVYQDEDIYPDYYFSLVRLLRDVYNEKFGVLVINLNKLELRSILNHQPFDTFLINDDKIIVAGNNEKYIGKKIDFDEDRIFNRHGYPIYYDGKKYQVFGIYLPLTGDNKDFYLISMVPLEFIMNEPLKMQYFALLIIMLSIFLSTILIFILSKNMSKRVAILNNAVSEISHGNLDLDIPLKGKDEIGELAENVKIMAKNIKNLNELVIKQKDMKLKLLTNQFNPHFLFNTLETIHMMAICSEQKEIADISLKLGNLLRKIVESKGEPIRLDEELNFVRDYLEIQKYRFRKIEYRINILEDIRNIYILPFLIQPIVENSIIHGLEGKADKGLINITIISENNKFIISIEDNGVGMDKDEISAILGNLHENGLTEKTGLRNTLERIKLFYGEEYGIRIESEKGKGTKVDIILPYSQLLRGEESHV
jgi:two-component system sensor histidine kinase YesM